MVVVSPGSKLGHFFKVSKKPPPRAILKELRHSPNTRMLLVSAIFLQVAQEFAGIKAVFFYSTIFFEGVIEDPLIGAILVGVVSVLTTVVALFLVNSFGRRTLVLLSVCGMFVSCLVIVASCTLSGYLSSMAALVAVNTYTMFFELGLGVPNHNSSLTMKGCDMVT